MKSEFCKILDNFTITARLMPVITAISPFLILGLSRGLIANEIKEASIEFVLAIVLAMYGALIAREKGKDFEQKMYKELGALPITIIMRFSDDRINVISKKQYHEWLNRKGFGSQLPLSLEEERKDSLSDEKYVNAMKNLRVHADNHRDENPRVYQELKKYNYWRNLYGCKKGAMVIYTVAIVVEIFQLILSFYFDLFHQPLSYLVEIMILVAWAILFCVTATQNTVKRSAFDYAITLLETGCRN